MPPTGGNPILMSFGGPQPQNRLTVLVRIILAIPHLIVLWLLGIAVFVVVIIGWFAALVLGELPNFAREMIGGYVMWFTRVGGYVDLLTDVYPPFSLGEEPQYPIRVALPPPEKLNRLAVFFRIILVIPAYIISAVISGIFLGLLLFVGWLVALVTGQLPNVLYEVFSTVIRYQARLFGYFTMVTPEYPWGPYGDTPPYTVPGWEVVLSSGAKTLLTIGIVVNVIWFFVGPRLGGHPNNSNPNGVLNNRAAVVVRHQGFNASAKVAKIYVT